MNQRIPLRRTTVLAAVVIMFAVTATMVAQTQKVEGLIKARSGSEMVVQTKNNTDLVVILTDSTDVAQLQGMLKARNKKMSMAALIPGLAVQVEGTSNPQNQLVATKVRFKGNDLEQAQSMEAAMHETKLTNQQQQEELAKQNAELQAHKEALQAQQAQINANKAAINEAVAKFGQLDDYYIFDEVTVYFGNGKTTVDPKYVPQLTELAQKAAKINGYMIEVKGYASSSGSTAINQKLSVDRANNVTTILLQQGKVPLTRMLAPGAMGESEQVSNSKTSDSDAENRRVVVRVLQNKAIAGI